MDDIRSTIGNAIASRRSEINMEQEKVCDYAQISKTTLSMLENAKGNISLLNLERILDVLGLEIVVRVKEKG